VDEVINPYAAEAMSRLCAQGQTLILQMDRPVIFFIMLTSAFLSGPKFTQFNSLSL
jgi:hypothetical protein